MPLKLNHGVIIIFAFDNDAAIVAADNKFSSNGQIQIAIRFKSQLNHLRCYLTTGIFDLNARDSIWMVFEIRSYSV